MLNSDLVALLAACHAAPANDLPLLVLADWLHENASACTPCRCARYTDDPANPWRGEPGYHPARDPASGRHEGGWTNCKTCNNAGGTPGWARDGNGYGKRAELIRLQCELAAHGWDESRRKSPTWACFCASVAPGHHCSECLAKAKEWIGFRRRERELVKSHGKTWYGPANWVFGLSDGVSYALRRGLLHVEAPLDPLLDRLPRMGSELLWVGSVKSDREPHYLASQKAACWYDERLYEAALHDHPQTTVRARYIPHELFVLMPGNPSEPSEAPKTPDLAHAALSRAILTLCRERAGLTPPRTTTEEPTP